MILTLSVAEVEVALTDYVDRALPSIKIESVSILTDLDGRLEGAEVEFKT